MPLPEPALVIRPANDAGCADLETVFGTRGAAYRCECQRYKLAPRESFGSVPVEERAARLRDQTACGDPDSPVTSGLVAYLDDQPVGWCAVEPRPAYQGLLPDDTTSHPTKSSASLRYFAGTPTSHPTKSSASLRYFAGTPTSAISEELHVGTVRTFAAAGLVEVSRPSPRRVVMRLDFRD
jgi:hypothetical protein